jgi:hypothetical protein
LQFREDVFSPVGVCYPAPGAAVCLDARAAPAQLLRGTSGRDRRLTYQAFGSA